MKKAIFPLILAVAAAALSYAVTNWLVRKEARQEAGYRAGLLELHNTFLQNNSVLRPISDMQQRPDLQKYLNEVNVLANWYFKNPAKEFWNQYADRRDPESIITDYRRRAESEGRGHKQAKSNLPIREESYALARKVYDGLRQGTYKAEASAFDGSVRFDVFEVAKDGNKLHWNFMAWGGIGDLVYQGWRLRWYKEPTPEEVAAYDKEVALAERRNREPELPDPATQHFAEASSASGSPVLPLFNGEDYIADFPAGAEMNYFVTPACPPDAEELEIVFRLKARAISGGDQPMEFSFRLPVRDTWKGSWEGVRKVEAEASY